MKFVILFCVALSLAACEAESVTLRLSGAAMGTTYNIVAIDDSANVDPETARAAIAETLARVDALMSNWNPDSEISRFNARADSAPTPISAELARVMRAANATHEGSLGLFDVTLGPLIELWGFGARRPDDPVPSDAQIADALAHVGQGRVLKLTSDPDALAKTDPNANVHLAAIAKGYGIDQVAATLREMGLKNYMVEIGGDLVTAGVNPDGRPWRVGLERPDSAGRAVEEIIAVSDLGVATSGDYRNFFEVDGARYSHVIDPTTGRPITHGTASVSVVAEDAMIADAWATALLALGAERGLGVAEKHGLAVFFIVRAPALGETSFTTVASSRFEGLRASK